MAKKKGEVSIKEDLNDVGNAYFSLKSRLTRYFGYGIMIIALLIAIFGALFGIINGVEAVGIIILGIIIGIFIFLISKIEQWWVGK